MTKVIIGSKYTGPAWDRPSLRRLPPGWILEESRKPKSRPVRSMLIWAFWLAVGFGYVAALGKVIA